MSRRHIIVLLLILLSGGCRDRFLSTAYVAENGSPSGQERFLYTDLDRMVVVSTTVSGEETIVVPTKAENNGLSGEGPLLSSPPRQGVMPITRRQGNSYLIYTAHRLDGTYYKPKWLVGMDPRAFVSGSFILSSDLEWFALLTLKTDVGSPDYSDLYLYTETLTSSGPYYEIKVGDASHVYISSPRFSPGPSPSVAFLRTNDAAGVDLVKVAVDGSDVSVLVSGAMPADRTAPRLDWSPDGSTIAVAGLISSTTILFIPRSGGDARTFTVDGVRNIRGLSWSPDGASVAFSGVIGANEDIFTMEASTGTVRNVSRTDADGEFAPEWSPDGRRIACVVARGEGASGSPAVYDLTLGTRRIYQGRTSGVFWER